MPQARFPGTPVTGYRRASSAPIGEEISSPYMGVRGVAAPFPLPAYGLSGRTKAPELRRTPARQDVVFGHRGFRSSRTVDIVKGGGAGKGNLGVRPRGWSRPSLHVSNPR
jgi:hypothetical protein